MGQLVKRGDRPNNLQCYKTAIHGTWSCLKGKAFDYIRIAFADGGSKGGTLDWKALVKSAAKYLKPNGVICVTDVQIHTDYGRWVEASARMRAHTGYPFDALASAGFKVDDRGNNQILGIGQATCNDRDLFREVLERSKRFFAGALHYSPGSGRPAELMAELAQNVGHEAKVHM